MVPKSHVLAFAAVVTVGIAIPGPSVPFTISRALTVGRRSALLTVVGNEFGLHVQVAAVAFGVGAVGSDPRTYSPRSSSREPRTWSTSASRPSGTGGRWPRH